MTANQTVTHGDLGGMAYQAPEAVVIAPQPTATPAAPGELCFQLTDDTHLAIKVKGLDGTVRSVTLTLA